MRARERPSIKGISWLWTLNARTGFEMSSPQTDDFSHRCLRIKSENAAKFDELDDIDTPLTAFEPRHERLILAEPFSQLRLGHASGLAPLDQERDKGLVPI